MLHKEPHIISLDTFTLIQQLQSHPALQDYYLVGGTALALQLGHRTSVDIDLFTRNSFIPQELYEQLRNNFSVTITMERKNTMLAMINNVKTDFITHDYPLLHEPIQQEGIRMLGMQDIAAMKLHAIIQSGKRLKDFIDIYFLLEHYSMQQIVDFFSSKYQYMNAMIALKAVNYFNDIDEDIDPPNMKDNLAIDLIKNRITQATLHTTRVFK